MRGIGPQCSWKIELDALSRSCRRHLLEDGICTFRATEFASVDVTNWGRATDRGSGVELIRPIRDVDRLGEIGEILGQSGHCTIETRLADVAPGTHDVGPDVDSHLLTLGGRLGGFPP